MTILEQLQRPSMFELCFYTITYKPSRALCSMDRHRSIQLRLYYTVPTTRYLHAKSRDSIARIERMHLTYDHPSTTTSK